MLLLKKIASTAKRKYKPTYTNTNTIINPKTQTASARTQLVNHIHAKMQTHTVAQAKKYKHTGKEIRTDRQRNTKSHTKKYKQAGKIQKRRQKIQAKICKHAGKQIQTRRQTNTKTQAKQQTHAQINTNTQAK